MLAYVRYRLPGETLINEITTHKSPLQCASISEIPQQKGYVFAPFQKNEDNPLWFIPADEYKCWEQPSEVVSFSSDFTIEEANREEYAQSFAACQNTLLQGVLQKVVLSRTLKVRFSNALSLEEQQHLFERACITYPQSFVSLVSLPAPWGTWLMATPEILLSAEESRWRTMALAGTMEKTDDCFLSPASWSQKDCKEQQWVVDYIRQQLESIGYQYQKSDTYVRPAAHLLHLCTDFEITPPQHHSIYPILEALHPTPAVCGWPTLQAKIFITQIEPHNRGYYSGYSGPISSDSAQLFVTLRCLHLLDDSATLYAGGGLLAESNENSEWQETERKLKTILRLFARPETHS